MVQGGFAYLDTNYSGTERIIRVPTAGGAAQVLASGSASGDIFVDGSHIYFAASGGEIRRVPLAGGTVEVIASGQGSVRFLAGDASSVYWVSGTSIVRASK